MSTEIVKAEPTHRGGGALSLGAMTPHDAWKFAEALAGARLLPQEYQNNPGSVLWAMEYGRALGLDVVTTITTIHVIKGKPTQSADLMLSRAREAGHRVRIKSERERCVVTIVRRDDPEDENVVEWTLADARTAGLLPGKADSNWAKYPRAMLRARAIAECVRSACPEVLHGAIYTAEELGARVDDAGLPVEAEVQQLRRVQPGDSDPWATAAPQPQTAAQGRDYLHEAREAQDANTVRRIWQDAKNDGAVPEYLDQIAAVGKEKAAAEQPAATEDEVVDATIVDTPEDDHAAAVAELREAANAARLEDFEQGAAMALGMPIEQASADAIRALAAQIRPAA